jgi:hypothetical protein
MTDLHNKAARILPRTIIRSLMLRAYTTVLGGDGIVHPKAQAIEQNKVCRCYSRGLLSSFWDVSDGIGIVQPSARGVAVHGDTDQEPRTIQLVPTLLNDGIRLGDTDGKVRIVQLER